MAQNILPLFPEAGVQSNRFEGLRLSGLTEPERNSVVQLVLKILRQRHRRGRCLQSPDDSAQYLQLLLGEREAEVFGCLLLDNRHRLIANEALFQGTVDGASVHTRIVVQRALVHNAAAIVCYHNHPSGVAEPSRGDVKITQRLKEALALVDVRILDHIVVAREGCTSLAERGLI